MNIRHRSTAACAAITLLGLGTVAVPLAAQQRPTTTTTTTTTTQRPAAVPAARKPVGGFTRAHAWEFTLSGALFSIDAALNDKLRVNGIRNSTSKFMFGGDLGIGKQLSNNLGFAIGTGVGTGGGAMVLTPRAEIVWTTGINNNMNLFVPLGVGVTRHTAGGPTDANRFTSTVGLHAGLGFRAFLSQSVAFRAEGRMTYDTYEETFNNGKSNAFNGQANAGLSFFAGTGRRVDTDGDGIFDNKDRCAATPRGATVDVNGCPADADRDGVWNGIDRCANTPAGTAVDAVGCPRDTDGDGVNDSADRCAGTPAGTRVDATGCPLDADGDGVADAADRCANTPRGTVVDANGCPRDADGDGVLDAADRCPNSPAGQPVNATGCPRDTDGDGVVDSADRCAGTPTGVRVDANGCPLAPDADRDGVEDSRDRCPNTPAGRMVDANGCPMAELPAVGASLIIRNINFVTNRANLTRASAQPLRDLALSMQAVLRQNPNARFEVAGYTDSQGSDASNLRLSQLRANSVKTAFTTAGVAASALSAVGYGEAGPIAPNTTAAGRAQNRRVEIKRIS